MSLAPPFFEILADSPLAKEQLGGNDGEILRVFPFGDAPEGVAHPYVAWQVIGGGPKNLLCGAPTLDVWGIQVDIYGRDAKKVRETWKVVRDAIEADHDISAFRGESRDKDTGNYRISFDCDLGIPRAIREHHKQPKEA